MIFTKHFWCYTVLVFFLAFSITAQPESSEFRPKIGLALSGGGALGISHIGVLEIIDSLGIPIDYVAGTSMGALIGAVYSMGYSTEEMKEIIFNVDWQDLFDDEPSRNKLPLFEKSETGKYQLNLELDGFTPKLPSGLIQGQKIQMLFSTITAPYESVANFDELPIPFRCVSADLVTGREVVFKDGSLSMALRASMSIPTAFSPVDYGDSLLVDGGLTNNFPTDIVKNMGADYVIGIALDGGNHSKNKLKSIFDILDRTTDIPRLAKLYSNIDLTDAYLETDVSGYTIMDFSEESIKKLIERGKKNARENIQLLKKIKKSIGDADSENLRAESKRKRELFLENPPLIKSVLILGNTTLEFNFLYTNLNITPGNRFNVKTLNDRITYLYSLGYFDKVSYTIENRDDNSVNLILTVKEKSFSKLNVGLKYDDYYRMVPIFGINIKSILFNGTRLKADYQFGGFKKFSLHFSYPSRTLNRPLYPYIKANYKSIPFDLYEPSGLKFAKYTDRSWSFGVGFGLTLGNLISFEAEVNRELLNLNPEIAFQSAGIEFPYIYQKLSRVILRLSYDSLDDVLLPRNGIVFNSYLEKGLKNLESDQAYNKIEADIDMYFTPIKYHTFKLGATVRGYIDNLPIYKFFYFGGPSNFVGIDYNQAIGTKFNVGRFEYIYEFKKDIFFRGIFNISFDNELSFSPSGKPFMGYGAGVTFDSILGLLNIIIANGDENLNSPGRKKMHVYFTAGFKF